MRQWLRQHEAHRPSRKTHPTDARSMLRAEGLSEMLERLETLNKFQTRRQEPSPEIAAAWPEAGPGSSGTLGALGMRGSCGGGGGGGLCR